MATKAIRIGDKEFTAKKLTFNDLQSFTDYIRNKRMQDFKETVKDMNLGGHVIANTIREIRTESCLDAMSSAEGMRYLLWLALKDNDKAITIEQAGELINQENAQDIMRAIELLPDDEEEDDKKELPDPLGAGVDDL